MLKDLHITHEGPVTVFCDNRSAIHVAKSPIFHERTKHIEIDCLVVREKLQSCTIALLPVRSHQQNADCFTKPLSPGPFRSNITKLNMMNIFGVQLEGGLYNMSFDIKQKRNDNSSGIIRLTEFVQLSI